MKALAKDVDDRYQNAIDLHDDLQAFMYTAGEFYSRKDLAAWMKRVFAQEIEEESAKLEQYRHMPVPPVAPSVQQPMPGVSAGSADRPRRTSGPMAVVPPPPPVPVRNSGAHAIRAAAGAGRRAGRWSCAGRGRRASSRGTTKSSPPTSTTARRADAGDAVVDDKPDLSKLELAPDGAPVPHHSVAQKLPTAPARARPSQPQGRRDAGAGRATARRARGAIRSTTFSRDAAAATLRPWHRRRRRCWRRADGRVRWRCGWAAAWRRRRSASRRRAGVVYYNSRPGTLFIVSDPATNVQVLLDNKRQAVDGTPATLKLEPGSYVLTVQREGYVPWNEQVEIKPGDTTRRRITLDPLASGTGFTLVSDPPGAQALLDGRALEGVTPLKVQSVMPGKHKIEVKTAAGSWQQEVTIEAGKMLDVRATVGAVAQKQRQRSAISRPPRSRSSRIRRSWTQSRR